MCNGLPPCCSLFDKVVSNHNHYGEGTDHTITNIHSLQTPSRANGPRYLYIFTYISINFSMIPYFMRIHQIPLISECFYVKSFLTKGYSILTHAHTHERSNTHSRTHSREHTRTHARTLTCSNKQKHKQTHTRTHTH